MYVPALTQPRIVLEYQFIFHPAQYHHIVVLRDHNTELHQSIHQIEVLYCQPIWAHNVSHQITAL